ncbi:peptidylprolyl isomerase [Candidatus Woesearchaeota archaeon]|nr:peptidylprolyl isomerase [Candidatus Woesearchaeota archaeon]
MEEPTTNQIQVKKKIKWNRVVIVSLVIIVLILLVPMDSGSFGKKILDSITGNVVGSDILAVVDSDKITKKELDKEFNALSPQLKQLYTNELLLRELIDEKLILAEAKKQNMEVADEELDNVLNAAKQNFPPGVTLEQLAETQGFTLNEFKEKIRNQILVKKFMDKNVMVRTIGEKQAKEFFDLNKDTLKNPEMVNTSHILVATKEEADTILKELKNGERFEDIARERSLDPGSKDNGGNLGYFPKGTLVKEYEDVAFSLNIRQISNPVKSQFGYHLIRIEAKKEASEAKFEDIKQQIIEYLQKQEDQQELKNFRDALFIQALDTGRVEIFYEEDKNLSSEK